MTETQMYIIVYFLLGAASMSWRLERHYKKTKEKRVTEKLRDEELPGSAVLGPSGKAAALTIALVMTLIIWPIALIRGIYKEVKKDGKA